MGALDAVEKLGDLWHHLAERTRGGSRTAQGDQLLVQCAPFRMRRLKL
jgi:hypothetical protein